MHDFDQGETESAVTEEQHGVIKFTCNTCGYVKKETAHNFELSSTDVVLSTGDKLFEARCTVCGLQNPTMNKVEHTFSDDWETDETSHWHKATCQHEVTTEKQEHTFVEGVCSVCNYLQNELLSVTLSYSGATGNLSTSNGADKLGADVNLFNITSVANSGHQHVGINQDGSIRLYKNGVCSLVITINGEYCISEIEVKLKDNSPAPIDSLKVVSSESTSGSVVAGNSGRYLIGGKSCNLSSIDTEKQLYIESITIYYTVTK